MTALSVAAAAVLALVAFASNSILCRGALGAHAIAALPFTVVRLACGAATLALVARGRGRVIAPPVRRWEGALALFAYAACFSFAYLRIGAGIGALVLFAVTQATMIGWGLLRGERPSGLEWLGIAVALGGLAALTAPGATAPDPLGVVLMAAAGAGWGAYSLLGRGAGDPIAANASAFARALLPAAALALLPGADRAWTGRGLALAAVSGAIASGLGYSLWYAALPHLTRTRAAAVQLAVPALAAAAAVLVLGERATPRLLVCGGVITAGVALALLGRARGGA